MAERIALVDQESRDIISKEIKTNLLVEAGAGSGKTSEMANRVTALVSSGYRKIGEIVAITFTKKAANELQERIKRKLETEYEKSKNINIKEAIDNYHECFVGTIHSFCTKLLKERPIEAKVDPNFDEIDEHEDELIRQLVWEEYVYGANEGTKELLKEIDRFALKEAALKNFLKIVCDNQDVEYISHKKRNITMQAIVEQVDTVFDKVCAEMKKVIDNLPDDIEEREEIDNLQRTALLFYKKTNCLREPKFEEKIKILKLFSSKSSVGITQNKWASDKEGKAYAKQLGIDMAELREGVIIPCIEELNVYIYNELLIPFANEAKVIYQKHKNINSKLNFQDLLIKSTEMLKNYPEVRVYFQNKYKTLLVDEFQDTDPIQSQLLMYLVGKDVNEMIWTKLIPNEGSLFVVGDPKQSIYGFRRADIEIYDRFKEIIKNTGGKCVELVTNFRTVLELGEWYNNTFNKLLNERYVTTDNEETKVKLDNIKQASFTNMSTIKKALPDTFSGVFYYKDNASKVEDIIELEGQNLANIIKWLVATQEITVSKTVGTGDSQEISYSTRPIQYKDIMILSVKKGKLTDISRMLMREGIPVKVTGANVIEKTPSFSVLVNIIKMLAYPEENSYLYRVMTEQPFYFTDHEIVKYVKMGGKFNIYFNFDSIWENLSYEDKTIIERIRLCFEMLKEFAKMSEIYSCATLVEKIIEKTGLQKGLIESSEKMNEIGSFTSLIEYIRMQSVLDVWDLDKLVESIDGMILSGTEEENDIAGLDYNAVRMMNVHKSKGLEAPIVILAVPCSGKMPADDTFTEHCKGENGETVYYGHVRLATNPDSQYSKEYIKSDNWNEWEDVAVHKSTLEDDRLLYVAATRARNALIISDSPSKQNPWIKLLECLPKEAIDLTKKIEDLTTSTWENEISNELADVKEARDVIDEINKKSSDAFINNVSTYNNYTPSTITNNAIKNMEISDELVPYVESKSDENVVYINFGENLKNEVSNLELGSIIHKLFEIEISIGNAEEKIGDILDNTYSRNIEESHLIELLEKFRVSNLYSRIKKSDKVYTEVPIMFKFENNYLNGKIDLVFYENGTWIIVDYKTCEFGQPKKDLYNIYSPQLRMYKESWRKVSKCDDIKTEILFIEKK